MFREFCISKHSLIALVWVDIFGILLHSKQILAYEKIHAVDCGFLY